MFHLSVNFTNFLTSYQYFLLLLPTFVIFITFHQLLFSSTFFNQLLPTFTKFYQFSNVSSKNIGRQNLLSSIITHTINTTKYLELISSENLSNVSIKILVSSNFSMPIIILTFSNTSISCEYI